MLQQLSSKFKNQASASYRPMFARFAFDFNCPNCCPPRDNTIILPSPHCIILLPLCFKLLQKYINIPSFHLSQLSFLPPQQPFELLHLSPTITHNHPTSLLHEQNGLDSRPSHLTTQHRHLQRQDEASPACAPTPEIPDGPLARGRRRPRRRHHRHWAQGHADRRFA